MNNHHPVNKQNGAVLFVSLIILVIMTLIGISSMQTSTMEERMSANTQNHAIAFQAAESAISNAVSNNTGFIASPTAGPQNSNINLGTGITSQASIGYVGRAIKSNSSIGKFMAQQFEITGVGRVQGSGAIAAHTQGVERTERIASN